MNLVRRPSVIDQKKPEKPEINFTKNLADYTIGEGIGSFTKLIIIIGFGSSASVLLATFQSHVVAVKRIYLDSYERNQIDELWVTECANLIARNSNHVFI